MTAKDIFDCTNIDRFIAAITAVLPYKGISNSKFYMCELAGASFLTKVSLYYKTASDVYGAADKTALHPTDVEIKILTLFKRQFTNTNITPCVIELMHVVVCDSISSMISNPQECAGAEFPHWEDDGGLRETLCRYSALVKDGLVYDKCAFIVLDQCDITLSAFMHKMTPTATNAAICKSFIFLVLHAFDAFTRKYPRFAHGDLHAGNVMIKFDPSYVFDVRTPMYLELTAGSTTYAVPYFGMIPKIIDFGFAALPELDIVSTIAFDKYHAHHRMTNDLILLFSDVHHIANEVGLAPLMNLLSDLMPNHSYIDKNMEYIHSITSPGYTAMMSNAIWDSYRVPVNPNSVYKKFAA